MMLKYNALDASARIFTEPRRIPYYNGGFPC